MKLSSEFAESGALMYRRLAFEGSRRRSGSKPQPPIPAIVGWPKVALAAVVAAVANVVAARV